jgi:Tol biopolymer transport system component
VLFTNQLSLPANHRATIAPSLLLLLAAACAGRTPPASTPPTAASAPASPAYIRPDSGERHLRNIRQITFGGNNAESYFSRSNRQLIFQRQEKVDAGCDQQYMMNLDGSNMRRVSNGLGRTTCGFFYDGDRRIVYSSTFKHDTACPTPPDRSQGYVWPLGHLEIYTSKLDGTDLRQVTNNGAYNAETTLSPDGKKLIFTSTMEGDIELYTMNVDGTGLERITNRVGYDGGAWFSPSGKQIVWRAAYPKTAADTSDYRRLLGQRLVRPARTEVFVADADGNNVRQVTNLGGANFAPVFTPDGRKIIFSSNYEKPRSGNFDLFLINVDGTGLERVTTNPDFDSFPMLSYDGRKLVWASNRNQKEAGETNLFIAEWVE